MDYYKNEQSYEQKSLRKFVLCTNDRYVQWRAPHIGKSAQLTLAK